VLLPLVAITKVPLAGPVVRLGARAVVRKEVAQAILADSPAAIADRIRGYADAGATEVILSLRPPFDRDLLRRFAQEIMPSFR
jgi:alkanesulfonate monooxygenase SsuD/methylene tetrahydromethanopterin reductase-like flavin-dependent oxidoreductase (luciferase family)